MSGLRVQNVTAAGARVARTPQEWRRAEIALVDDGTAAMLARDADAYEALFDRVRGWDDPHRALNGRKQLLNAAGEMGSRVHQALWVKVYLACSRGLTRTLRDNPIEPYDLNALGVCLFELCADRAAVDCFRACLRLEPDHQDAQRNLRAARRRLKRPYRNPLSAEIRRLVDRVAEDAKGAVAAVRLPDAASMRLSLVMIVKDEQEMLPACLDSVRGVCDELIVVDTGSSDDTRRIALERGATIIDFPWNGSFADARNVSLQAATGDWVLHLDADERLVEGEGAAVRALLSKTWREAFTFAETNFTGAGGADSAVVHQALRLWRNRPEYRYEGAIHEQKTQTMPVYCRERFEDTTLRILHYGYLKARVTDRAKSERNIELLVAEAKQDRGPFNRFNLGSEHLAIGQPADAAPLLDEALAALGDDVAAVGYGPLLAHRAVRAHRQTGDTAHARALAGRMLRVFARHTDLVFERALCHTAEGDIDEAISDARRALEMGDAPAAYGGAVGAGSFLAQGLLGELQLAAGDPQAAAGTLRESLSRWPHYLQPVSALARALHALRVPADDVVGELRPLVEAQITTAGVLLAATLLEIGAADQAGSLFDEALRRSPQHPVARVGAAEVALAAGDLDAAVAVASPADGPLAAQLARVLAFVALVRGDHQHAREVLDGDAAAGLPVAERAALAAWTDAASGQPPGDLSDQAGRRLVEMLDACLRLQAFEACETLIVLAASSELVARERHELAARTYLRRGFLQSAAEEWLAAIDESGPDADSVLGLAQVAYAEGDRDQARALAADAVTLDPDHPGARAMTANLA